MKLDPGNPSFESAAAMGREAFSRRVRHAAAVSWWMGVLVATAGLCIFGVWDTYASLTRVYVPGMTTMKTNSALAFSLLGAGLVLAHVRHANRPAWIAAVALPVLVVILAFATLLQDVFGTSFGIDELFYEDLEGAAGTGWPNRMAPQAAAGFILLGFALLFIDREGEDERRPSEYLAGTAMLLGCQAVLGYAFNLHALYGIRPYTDISLSSSIVLTTLSAGVFLACPDRGFIRLAFRETAGGFMIRRLVPTVILLPIAFGLVDVVGSTAGFYELETGLAVLLVGFIVILTVLIWVSAIVLDRSDAERLAFEEQLHRKQEALDVVNRVGQALSAELDLERLVQTVTDAATRLSSAAYGTFFYNVIREDGERYLLHAISGASKEAFTGFPTLRNTELFSPTFRGEGILRLDDVTRDSRYGRNASHAGVPTGHLPVRSYMAVPVVSRSGEVFGALFLGHPEAARFSEREERIVVGLAAQAAIAIDNARLYEAERRARTLAERSNAAKDEFLAMLGHELRNPISAIANSIRVLEAGRLPDRIPELHGIIARQVRHVRRLVDDLLDVSRLDSGKIAIRKERVDIGELVARAIESFQNERRALTLEVESVWVDGDPARLEQILGNLVENALKFTPEEGTIAVRVFADGGDAVLEVRDTGCGISEEMLPRVFDIFIQGRPGAAGLGAGLGLGLTVVRRLAELHGGTASVESDGPGTGSRFTVRLPRRETAAPAVEAAPEVDIPRRRVLVVEDHEDARESLRTLLETLGHEVEVASTGAEGIRRVSDLRPDVVILDIGLPDMDGGEVARQIRTTEVGRSTRIVALSGFGEKWNRERLGAGEFDARLVKPLDHESLLRVLGEGRSAA